MDALSHGIRLIVGLCMVAAGSTLVAPAGLSLARVIGQQTVPPAPAPALPERGWADDARSWPPVSDAPLPPPVVRERLEYIPPPMAPQPLPPQSAAMMVPGPDLATGYRPTLQSPPPPLLDGQSPPPLAVGWTPRQPASAWRGQEVPPSGPPPAADPTIYIVRDGDDLTSIAARFYGHPAAVAAIWEANRALLRDPGILPIGAALVLPPRAVVAGLGRAADESVIEPRDASQPGRPLSRGSVSRPASWLTGAEATVGGPQSP